MRNFILIIVFTILGACSAPLEEGILDPFEASNRQVHEINKSLDKNIVRPVAVLYGDSTPVKIQSAVNNIAMNFSLPSNSINYIFVFIDSSGAVCWYRILVISLNYKI